MTHILGYARLPDGAWEPIQAAKKGYIYTAAVITCSKCSTYIRSIGGPMEYSLCMKCFKDLSPGYTP